MQVPILPIGWALLHEISITRVLVHLLWMVGTTEKSTDPVLYINFLCAQILRVSLTICRRTVPLCVPICRFAIKQTLVHFEQSSLLKCLAIYLHVIVGEGRWTFWWFSLAALKIGYKNLATFFFRCWVTYLVGMHGCFTPGKFIAAQQSQPLSNERTVWSRLACALYYRIIYPSVGWSALAQIIPSDSSRYPRG